MNFGYADAKFSELVLQYISTNIGIIFHTQARTLHSLTKSPLYDEIKVKIAFPVIKKSIFGFICLLDLRWWKPIVK